MSVMTANADQPLSPSVARRWINANAVAALLSAVAGLARYALEELTGGATAERSAELVIAHSIVAFVLYGLAGGAAGVLTGAVLQRGIPMLPARAWIALHAAIGATVGLTFGTSDPGSAGNVPDVTPSAFMVPFGLILGLMFGAMVGGLQALVLRRVASGSGTWVAWSAMAYSIGLAAMSGVLPLLERGNGFTRVLTYEAIGLVVSVIVAMLLLPALYRLRPL